MTRAARRAGAAAVAALICAGGCEPTQAGVGRAATSGDATSTRATSPVVAAEPSSADYLALLPDGAEKRRFLLDCTNCHTFDERIAFVEGRPRSRAAWVEITERMLGYAGANTAFPVMGVRRDAEATADWLLRHGPHAPPTAGPRGKLPAGSEVREFPLPEPEDLPHDLAILPDGRVLVTGMFTHRMWLLDPAEGRWDIEAIPVPDANPRAVALAPGGRGTGVAPDWWVLLGGPGLLARREGRTGAWTTYPIGFYGHSVAVDGRGRAWVNSHFTKNPGILARVDPGEGRVARFEIETPLKVTEGGSPIPYGLRVAPDGTVWSTELRGNRIVGFDPVTRRTRAHAMPVEVSGPRRPDVDAAGRLWIPEYAGNALTRFDPRTDAFRRYPVPIPDALPYVARVDRRRDRVWIGTAAADAVLLFEPGAERFTVYRLPSRGALVRHLDIDEESGEVWLAYGAAPGIPARIARLRP